MNTKYMTGFNPLMPAEVIKAHDRGMIRTEWAYEILQGLLDGHDHKDACYCGQYVQKLKEYEVMMEDEVHELEIKSVTNY